MKLLPSFREERILREEVALVNSNYFVGIGAYFLSTLLVTVIITKVSNIDSIYLWLAANTIACSVILFRYWQIRNQTIDAKKEAIIQVWSLFTLGLIWGFLPIFYFDGNSTLVMVAITGFSAGVAAGALTMQSPCLPVFLAFAYTSLPALAIGFFRLDDAVYNLMGLASLLFLGVLTYCARNLEILIVDSINLRFENIDLIEQLQSSVTATEQANRAKSVFLASASHDLRQPLHAMGLFIETLNSTQLDDYQKTVTKHIESASEATREMLNTLLNFSKVDAGVIEPKPSAFRVQTLFNKMENELAVTADNKQLIYRTRETSLAAYADVSLIELILRNLVTNAIRYTETGGLLIACRQKQDQTLSIEVWDTGIGIEKDQQSNIFREFHQLGNPERDRQKGFGLGLAIAKGLSDTMGLALTVNSKPEIGTVFRLQLPQANTFIVEDVASEPSNTRFDGKQILIVDDDEGVRQGMQQLLTSWGCDCTVAESADEALALSKGKNTQKDRVPDLLIVDYRLRENKNGREAIDLLRAELDENLPAIIITGDTAADRLREAQACDALLLHKPLASSDLQRAISSLLQES